MVRANYSISSWADVVNSRTIYCLFVFDIFSFSLLNKRDTFFFVCFILCFYSWVVCVWSKNKEKNILKPKLGNCVWVQKFTVLWIHHSQKRIIFWSKPRIAREICTYSNVISETLRQIREGLRHLIAKQKR